MKLKPVPSARRPVRDLQGSDAPPDMAPPPSSEVRGAIDNATADRLYGWAWDAANPGARLKVELRLAGEPVANTIADFVRPDLAKSGVGDGCHAFEFPLIPAWIERRAELTAVAFGADGIEVPISMRPRRPEEAASGAIGAQVARALDNLQGEQASIRAEFAALRNLADQLPDAAAVAAVHEAQETLHQKVEQLELWLARLDARLGDADLRARGEGSGRLDVWQAVLIATLASASSAALAVAVARFFILA